MSHPARAFTRVRMPWERAWKQLAIAVNGYRIGAPRCELPDPRDHAMPESLEGAFRYLLQLEHFAQEAGEDAIAALERDVQACVMDELRRRFVLAGPDDAITDAAWIVAAGPQHCAPDEYAKLVNLLMRLGAVYGATTGSLIHLTVRPDTRSVWSAVALHPVHLDHARRADVCAIDEAMLRPLDSAITSRLSHMAVPDPSPAQLARVRAFLATRDADVRRLATRLDRELDAL